jgi:hypothetical protein
MSDDENPISNDSANKPFFSIDAEDIADSAAPPVDKSLPPLAPMIVGALDGSTTQSAPQPQENTISWGGATPQMTGDVANMNGMFALQAPAEAAKSAFRWGQFAIGLFLPWVVFFGLVVVAGLSDGMEEAHPDFSRTVVVTMEPDENGWYLQSVDRNQSESMNFYFPISSDNSHYVDVYFWFQPYDAMGWENNGKVMEETYYRGDYNEEIIGEYTESNQTVWFKINESHSPSSNEVTIQYYDEEASDAYWDEQDSDGDMFETLFFCGGPIMFIVATITAFVKGNKGLGIGLLCSIPLSFIMGPVLFVLLLLMFGF